MGNNQSSKDTATRPPPRPKLVLPNDPTRCDFLMKFPQDLVIHHILGYLTIPDLLTCRAVSHPWKQLIEKSDNVFKDKVEEALERFGKKVSKDHIFEFKENHTWLETAQTYFLFSAFNIARNCSEKRMWIVMDRAVYDVTSFLDEHPGGNDILLEQKNIDAAQVFEDIFHSEEARKMRSLYFVGQVVGIFPKK